MAQKDYEKAILYGGDIQFIAKGKTFTVKPLPLEYIANGEFRKSGLCFQKGNGNIGLTINLSDKSFRAELDKWLRRLLFLDGESVTLEHLCSEDLDLEMSDISSIIAFVLEISGLVISESDNKTDSEETDYFPLVAFIQAKGNMRRDEILAAPLFLLSSLSTELYKIMQSELAGSLNASMLGMLGGSSGQPAQTQPQTKGDPRMGTTPQFKSRDEYFAFMNQHR